MQNRELDFDGLEQRVYALEWELQRRTISARVAWTALVLVILLIFFVACANLNVRVTPRAGEYGNLRARSLDLMSPEPSAARIAVHDGRGRLQILVGGTSKNDQGQELPLGAHIVIFDGATQAATSWGADADGSSLALTDARERPRIVLQVDANGPRFQILDEKGKATFSKP